MEKTIFEISKMDCPSEESLIRISLEDIKCIKKLDFDLSKRILTVFHEGQVEQIESVIEGLSLGGKRLSTTQIAHANFEDSNSQQKLLWTVLGINFAFFLIEMSTGIVSKSMGLVADSLDMLADSFVYGISLFAVGGTVTRKKNIAKIAGYFQIILALIGVIEVIRRYIGVEQFPNFKTMILVSTFALIANGVCLYILQKSKSTEAHMKASMIFTSNDVIINLGVICAGTLVYLLESGVPDLIIGVVVFVIVLRGSLRILRLGK